jgi:hypothetical protein
MDQNRSNSLLKKIKAILEPRKESRLPKPGTIKKGDVEHLQAMQEMSELMKTPNGMENWFDRKRMEFDALPESK